MSDTHDRPEALRRLYVQEKLFGCPELHATMTATVLADEGKVHVGAMVRDLRNDELMAMWAHCTHPIEELPALLAWLAADVLEVLEVLR